MPLHIMDAESQGSVGFLLQQALSNHLLAAGIGREVVTVVTRVAWTRRIPASPPRRSPWACSMSGTKPSV